MRSIAELAKEACDVQNACNISGVAHSFWRALASLREQPECTGNDWLDAHPVTRAYVDKLASLAGVQGETGTDRAMTAHAECEKLALHLNNVEELAAQFGWRKPA